MTVPSHALSDWLAYRARTTPERPAVVAHEVRWTFAELDERASRMARRLATLGIRPGDRVAALLRNGPAVAEIVHAVGRLGAVLVPLNIRLTPEELAWQIDDVGARLLVADAANAPLAAALGRRLPGTAVVATDGDGVDALPLASLPEADIPIRDRFEAGAVHSIIYTSGTTGKPKGAMLVYGAFWWNAVGSALNLGNHVDDRWLAVLPWFHVGGLSIFFRSVIYGIPAVVHEAFDAAAVNAAIERDRVTIISVVATMLQRMLGERGERPYPTWLRCVLLGGGPAPRPLLEACADRGIPVVQTYGLTETASQVATLAPEDALRKLGSAGKPLYPNAIRIAQGDAPLPAGQPGEIQVRGPVVTIGYAGRPEATARSLDSGWLRTGDVGYLDDEGYLYVLDRRDDLIVTGGENVYPAEVEAALLAHPAVEEAGVVGVPDAEWGDAVLAVVRCREGASVTEDELRAFCRARLAGYKVPKRIAFVDALPRNAAGKLLRRELRRALTS